VIRTKVRMMKLDEVELEIVKAAKDAAQQFLPTGIDLGTAAALGSLIMLKEVLRADISLLKTPEVQPYLGLIEVIREAAIRRTEASS